MKESLANDSCWWSGVKTLVASLRLKQRLWLAESHSSGSSSIWFDSDGSSEFSERGAGGRPPWARPPTCSAAGLSSNSETSISTYTSPGAVMASVYEAASLEWQTLALRSQAAILSVISSTLISALFVSPVNILRFFSTAAQRRGRQEGRTL